MAITLTTAVSPIRLTMRGRILIITGLLLAALLTVWLGWAVTQAVAGSARETTTRQVVVQPGQTLWQIAEQAAPAADPRDTVAVIMELNDLPSGSVQAGQALRVPA